jgi:flagellar basal body-associated protein FliL
MKYFIRVRIDAQLPYLLLLSFVILDSLCLIVFSLQQHTSDVFWPLSFLLTLLWIPLAVIILIFILFKFGGFLAAPSARKSTPRMKTRTALIIMLYAILTHFAGFFLYKAIDILRIDLDGDVYFLISLGLMYLGASLFIASVISGLLSLFTMKKGVSILVFLGIFIAGIVFFSYYMYHQWQSFHSFNQLRYLPL